MTDIRKDIRAQIATLQSRLAEVEGGALLVREGASGYLLPKATALLAEHYRGSIAYLEQGLSFLPSESEAA